MTEYTHQPTPDTVAPGCVLAGCGRSPADHVGWALGHLYRARLTPAEVQPPRAGATADHCTGCIVDHDPTECGYRPATARTHLDGCSAGEDPDGETMCVGASIAAAPASDPRDEEGCQGEFIDGSWYGDDCPDCREAVSQESAECEQCQEEDYCPKHVNGIYG